ncbi:MAG: hypothetical protein FH749_15505 [Firmicutes bacterium]|nr:hypothetical protein [Bacillota bacterium]
MKLLTWIRNIKFPKLRVPKLRFPKVIKITKPKLPRWGFFTRLRNLNYKALLQIKFLRWVTLGLLLFASIGLLVEANYGQRTEIIAGYLDAEDENVVISVVAGDSRNQITVPAGSLIRRQFEEQTEQMYLTVLRIAGNKVFFDRIQSLDPADINTGLGDNLSQVAVGVRPVLTEMIGLEQYIYGLRVPIWARDIAADRVSYHQDMNPEVKEFLDGELAVEGDVFLLDSQGRIGSVALLGEEFLTLPGFLRKTVRVLLYAAALGAFFTVLAYLWPSLAKKGRAIRDQVSNRFASRAS